MLSLLFVQSFNWVRTVVDQVEEEIWRTEEDRQRGGERKVEELFFTPTPSLS